MNEENSVSSLNKQTRYVIMIIDYLKKYIFNKQLEKGFKGFFYKGISSSATPNEYYKRFVQ